MDDILPLPHFWIKNLLLLAEITCVFVLVALALFVASLVQFIRWKPRPICLPLFVVVLALYVLSIALPDPIHLEEFLSGFSVMLFVLSGFCFAEVFARQIWRRHLVTALFALNTAFAHWFAAALLMAAASV